MIPDLRPFELRPLV